MTNYAEGGGLEYGGHTLNLVQNDNDLRVFCNGCHHCRELDVDALISRFVIELPEIGKRARYVECGIKVGSVQVVAVRWQG